MRLPAAHPIPFDVDGTSLQLAGGLTLILGWSILEASGAAPAFVNFYDGTSNQGTLVAAISLAQDESTRDLIPPPYVACYSGLFMELVLGAVQGCVWTLQATMEGGFAFVDGAIPWPSGES